MRRSLGVLLTVALISLPTLVSHGHPHWLLCFVHPHDGRCGTDSAPPADAAIASTTTHHAPTHYQRRSRGAPLEADRLVAAVDAGIHPPAFIRADCRADVTAALVAWIRTVPDNSTISFPSKACYQIEGSVWVKNRHNLTFEGNGATFRAKTSGYGTTPPKSDLVNWFWQWPQDRIHWSIEGGSGITLRNMVIRGPEPRLDLPYLYYPQFEGQYGVSVFGSHGTVLDHLTINDVFGDSIGVWGGATNTIIQNCHLERSGRNGISITNARWVTVKNSYVGWNGTANIDVEPDVPEQPAEHIYILHNEFGNSQELFFADGNASPLVGDIRIIGNRLHREFEIVASALPGTYSSHYVILNNVSDAPCWCTTAPAFRFNGIKDVRMEGNYSRWCPCSDHSWAVSLIDSHGVQVAHNAFPGVHTVLTTDFDPSQPPSSTDYAESDNRIDANAPIPRPVPV